MKKEKIFVENEEIEIVYFNNPMFHEDWHKAENMGLEFVRYSHHGPDYWDDKLCFCPKGKKEKVEKWFED